MIKVVAPNVALKVIDRAIQVCGGGRRQPGFPPRLSPTPAPAPCASPTGPTRCTARRWRNRARQAYEASPLERRRRPRHATPFDLSGQGRAHHRLEPRHRPRDRRDDGGARRQGRRVEPQGGCLRGGRRGDPRRAAARRTSSPATSRARPKSRRWSTGRSRQLGPDRHPRLQRRRQSRSSGRWRDLSDEAFDKIMGSNVRSTSGSAISCSPAWPSAAAAPSSSCPRSPACAAPR